MKSYEPTEKSFWRNPRRVTMQVLPGSGRSHPPLTGVETIGVDTPPLIMAMPVEPSNLG